MKNKKLTVVAFVISIISLVIFPLKDGNVANFALTYGGAILLLGPIGAILSFIALLKGTRLAWAPLVMSIGALMLLLTSGWSIQIGLPGI